MFGLRGQLLLQIVHFVGTLALNKTRWVRLDTLPCWKESDTLGSITYYAKRLGAVRGFP
jgi:hypothetical protein